MKLPFKQKKKDKKKHSAAEIVRVDPRAQALRGSCSANAEFVMEDMVKRDTISGLLLVTGNPSLQEKRKKND